MRAMRANGKLELEQQLVCRRPVRVVGAPILPAHLAEFAWPVGQHGRTTFIEQRRVIRALRMVVASADEPAARELVVARGVVTHRSLPSAELTVVAPDDLTAADELVIDRPPQR